MAYEEFEDDVSLDEEDRKHVKSTKVDKFAGELNHSYRVGLMYFHPVEFTVAAALKRANPQVTKEEVQEKLAIVLAKKAEFFKKKVEELAPWEKLDTSKVKFKKFEVQYKEGIGTVVTRFGKDGDDADKVWKTLGDVKPYYTTIYLVYPTDRNGKPKMEEMGSAYTIVARLSNKTYETLHGAADALRQNELSIASQDLTYKCTNKDFQNFDINPAGPSIWMKNPGFASKMLKSAYDQYADMDKLFRQMSTADLKIKLGVSSAGTEESFATDEFDAMLNNAI